MPECRGSIGSMDSSLKSLFPLIVPADYVQSGTWKLPHLRLRLSELILTWVVLHERQTMVYVTEDQVNHWKRLEIEWEQIAIENMKRDSGEGPATHEKRDASGNLQWIAMMQSDGLGSSRVLMTEELRSLFPGGYQLAIPERSVGMALSTEANPEDRAAFAEAVQKCYRVGITRMLGKLLDPIDVLPASSLSSQ